MTTSGGLDLMVDTSDNIELSGEQHGTVLLEIFGLQRPNSSKSETARFRVLAQASSKQVNDLIASR